MFKRLFQKTVLICGSTVPVFDIKPDDVEEFKAARGLFIEDDWERVKSIFQPDDYGKMHPELEYCITMAQYGLVVGGLIGGTIESIRTTREFIRNNDTNVYWTRNEALRKLNRISILGFVNGAWKQAPKYCIFFGGFSLLSSCCEMYRNKPGVIENTVGGAGVGAILRSHVGLKGAISGGIVGGILGTIYGFLSELIYKISNKDKVELKYVAIAFSRYKKQLNEMKTSEGKEHLKDKLMIEKSNSDMNDQIDRLKDIDMEDPVPVPVPVPVPAPDPAPVVAS